MTSLSPRDRVGEDLDIVRRIRRMIQVTSKERKINLRSEKFSDTHNSIYDDLVMEINGLIRYSENPVRMALASSLAFLYEAKDSRKKRKVVAAEKKEELSHEYGEMATTFLDCLIHGENNKLERLDLLLLQAEDDFSALVMAIELECYSFLSHRLVTNFVKQRWIGECRIWLCVSQKVVVCLFI